MAILLIASVALFVIAGTLIESHTDSHRYAALFAYRNPIFIVLLWGFFINILVSALHRWPFRWKHVPFLITHIGLLMILGGVLVKSYAGVQGAMALTEGSGNQEIVTSDSYTIVLEKRIGDGAQRVKKDYPLNYGELGQLSSAGSKEFKDLNIQLLAWHPHSSERWETWIKGDHLILSGMAPIPIQTISKGESAPVASSATYKVEGEEWSIQAAKVADVEEMARVAYIQDLDVVLTDSVTEQVVFQGPLFQLLQTNVELPRSVVKGRLDFHLDLVKGFYFPRLYVNVTYYDHASSEDVEIALDGHLALQNQTQQTSYLGKAPLTITLMRKNSVMLFLQDFHEDLFFFAYDSHGRVHTEAFPHGSLQSYIAYDQGFEGYAVQAQVTSVMGLQEQERKVQDYLRKQLKEGMQLYAQLSPPLQLLLKACEQAQEDFPEVCLEFLAHWNRSQGWLAPTVDHFPNRVQKVLQQINWESVPERDRRACAWGIAFFQELEPYLKQRGPVLELLRRRGWPLVSSLEVLQKTGDISSDNAAILTGLTQQFFAVGDQFPAQEGISDGAQMLSVYFRAFGIYLNQIIPSELYEQVAAAEARQCALECPLTVTHQTEKALDKLEENHPRLLIKFQKGNRSETVACSYDRYGTGMKWPVLGGDYLLHFQPQQQTIPYRVRLREARQVNYPHSNQPYSYESDVMITDAKTGEIAEATLSMNHVYETGDGYRFYLANLAQGGEGRAKRVQLVVNYDPAKYWLVYPGACILTLGIFLLFWGNKKRT